VAKPTPFPKGFVLAGYSEADKHAPGLHLLEFRAVELLDVFRIWFMFSGS